MSETKTTTLSELVNDIQRAIRFAKECIECSTEYRQGNPAYEQSAAELSQILKRVK